MKKRKKSHKNSSKSGEKEKASLSKKELEELKKLYKKGELKFDSKDIAQAMINDGINLKN